MDKKQVRKVDFLEVSETEKRDILRKALARGQEEQKKLEREYESLIKSGLKSYSA